MTLPHSQGEDVEFQENEPLAELRDLRLAVRFRLVFLVELEAVVFKASVDVRRCLFLSIVKQVHIDRGIAHLQLDRLQEAVVSDLVHHRQADAVHFFRYLVNKFGRRVTAIEVYLPGYFFQAFDDIAFDVGIAKKTRLSFASSFAVFFDQQEEARFVGGIGGRGVVEKVGPASLRADHVSDQLRGFVFSQLPVSLSLPPERDLIWRRSRP